MIKLTPKQLTKVNALIHSLCANCNSEGKCIMQPPEQDKEDKWTTCKCPQLNNVGLMCIYFRENVLPADKLLNEEIHNDNKKTKKCVKCDKPYVPRSNRAKYCDECAVKVNRLAAKESMIKKRKELEKENRG